jgi:LysR family glycine cleavage system transcriptional activator
MSELPSLNALRAFEAAARRGSMKAAAAELFVTPGAVSQQIKSLEESLGAPLFRRLKGGLTLTETGAALYPVLRESFESIARALERLKRREQAGPLTVSVLPSFAAKWLVPRLGRFRERHPEIDVRISANVHLADFTREDVDVGIRHGQGEYPGLRSDRLLSVPLYPVCSPRLLNGGHPLREPADLRFHTLLHDDSPREWRRWLKLHGVRGVDAERGPVFNDAAMAVEAAVEGQGVAMTRAELAEQDLAEGRLVKPFDLSLPIEAAYYFVSPEAVADWPKVVAFREWLLEEVATPRIPR